MAFVSLDRRHLAGTVRGPILMGQAVEENLQNDVGFRQPDQIGREAWATLVLSMSIGSTCAPSRLVGKPFFAGPRPPLRLVALIGEGTVRLTYVSA